MLEHLRFICIPTELPTRQYWLHNTFETHFSKLSHESQILQERYSAEVTDLLKVETTDVEIQMTFLVTAISSATHGSLNSICYLLTWYITMLHN